MEWIFLSLAELVLLEISYEPSLAWQSFSVGPIPNLKDPQSFFFDFEKK